MSAFPQFQASSDSAQVESENPAMNSWTQEIYDYVSYPSKNETLKRLNRLGKETVSTQGLMVSINHAKLHQFRR